MLAKRIVAIVILVPLAVILIALSVANRASTVLTVDPFNPALSYSAPLFVWLFGALLVGVVIGSAVTWLTQGKHRRRVRDSKQEAARLLERAEAAERRNTSVANT